MFAAPATEAFQVNETVRPVVRAWKFAGGPGIGLGSVTSTDASGDGALVPTPFTALTRAK